MEHQTDSDHDWSIRVEDYTFFDQEDTQEDLAEVRCMWSPM